MKHYIIPFAFLLALLLPACKKGGSSSSGGGGTTGSVYYPATVTTYQGSQNNGVVNFKFVYNSQHQLTFLGNSSSNFTMTSENITETVAGSSGDTIVIANNFNGDIYTGIGTTLVQTYSTDIWPNGTRTTTPQRTYLFGYAANNVLSTFDDGTETQHFTYDTNGNLTAVSFVTDPKGSPGSNSYNPGGQEFDRMTFKGYDTKPSPYSAVAGYRFLNCPWGYPQVYSFSLSQHNPTQIIEESLDLSTMQWSVYSQTDYTYVYNDQGYPSQIQIKITYPSSTNSTYYFTYNFTYTN